MNSSGRITGVTEFTLGTTAIQAIADTFNFIDVYRVCKYTRLRRFIKNIIFRNIQILFKNNCGIK